MPGARQEFEPGLPHASDQRSRTTQGRGRGVLASVDVKVGPVKNATRQVKQWLVILCSKDDRIAGVYVRLLE
jgi:hypothetical protein